VDVALTDNGAGRSEYWMNTMGIVFPGAMTIVSRQITRLRGFTMYLASILKTIFSHHTAPHMHIQVDGSVAVNRTVTLFTIANGPREGGGIPVIPDAKPDDGILHWVCVRRVGRLMMLTILPAVMAGKHLGWPQVTHGQGQRYVIDADQAMPIHLDGEIFASWEDDTRHLTIEVLPGALRVLV
jgi:diacylglycerol kinase family enzyme